VKAPALMAMAMGDLCLMAGHGGPHLSNSPAGTPQSKHCDVSHTFSKCEPRLTLLHRTSSPIHTDDIIVLTPFT
jgi:hypothetical protein